MLAFFVPRFAGLGDFFRFGHVFDVNILRRLRKFQRLTDFLHHLVRRTEDKHPVRTDTVHGADDILSLFLVPENRTTNCTKPTWFALGRFSGCYAIVVNQNPVVNDARRLIFMGNHQSPVAFARPWRPRESNDFHHGSSLPSL